MMSADWLGQKAPLPIPTIAAAPNACHGWCTTVYPAKPTASRTSAPISVGLPPILSTMIPDIGIVAMPTAALVPAMRPTVGSGKPRTLCR